MQNKKYAGCCSVSLRSKRFCEEKTEDGVFGVLPARKMG